MKNIIIILITTLLILSVFNNMGCLGMSNDENKSRITLSTPAIFINTNDELYIIWTEYNDNDWMNEPDFSKKDYKRKISIIDKFGKIIKNSYPLKDFPKEFLWHNFLIDSNNNLYIVSKVRYEPEELIETFSMNFAQYNNDLELSTPSSQLTDKEERLYFPKLCIDLNDNIFIVWEKGYSPSNSNIHVIKIDSHGYKLSKEIKVTNENEDENEYPLIFCDSNNSIHLKWQKKGDSYYYAKLSNDGGIIINATLLDNVTVIRGYPVVKDDLGNLVYLDKDGVVDSENNIHVFTKHEEGCCDTYKSHLSYEKISENGTILDQQIIYSNTYMGNPDVLIDTQNNIHLVWKEGNNIYYTKLDNNGNILIDRMLIVSGKVGKKESTPGFELIPLILVVVVAAVVMRRRR